VPSPNLPREQLALPLSKARTKRVYRLALQREIISKHGDMGVRLPDFGQKIATEMALRLFSSTASLSRPHLKHYPLKTLNDAKKEKEK